MSRRGKIIPFPGVRVEPEAPAGEARELVDVHHCHGAEAVVVRSLFESEGIPVLLRSRIAHSVHPFTVGAQGEIVVMVPATLAHRARRLLRRVERRADAP